MIYNKYDIIKVPFPFTDKDSNKKRPALIISSEKYQANFKHVILCMITSAKHSEWIDDIIIEELAFTGLSVPSKIRFKIFSLDEKLIIGKLGELHVQDITILNTKIIEYL
jgi:mRNA interferase MazF